MKETPLHSQAHTTPPQHHCCLQPPCLAYSYRPTNAATASDDLKKVVKELSSKVLQLSNDTTSLRGEVREAVKIVVSKSAPNVSVSAATVDASRPPLSPDIIVIEHGQHSPNIEKPTAQNDESDSLDNTIDDNVPDEPAGSSLNCNAPTTQRWTGYYSWFGSRNISRHIAISCICT